jgi:hypothetical protein
MKTCDVSGAELREEPITPTVHILEAAARAYLEVAVLLTIKTQPELKELSFHKTPIETPEGGIYLLSFLHITGPKINLHAEEKPFDVNDETVAP